MNIISKLVLLQALYIENLDTDPQKNFWGNIASNIKKINNGFLGDLANLLGNYLNLKMVFSFILFVIILFFTVFSFRKKVNSISLLLIEKMTSNGKYIRGLFVELNNTKENLRYFVNGAKWKYRIIKDFNVIFNDEYGKLLETIFKDREVIFHMKWFLSLERISEVIENALTFMKNIHGNKEQLSAEYKDSMVIFEIYGKSYVEKLEKLKSVVSISKSRYIVLTGSAGNGKTNIMCNLSEMLIRSHNPCFFFNARDVSNINIYFKDMLRLPNKIPIGVFLAIENCLCYLQRKKIYFLLDAVNENDDDEFYNSLPGFLDDLLRYKNVRVILSCRNEYFDLKYKKYLVERVHNKPYCFDMMQDRYSIIALNRMFTIYSKQFNFYGKVTDSVRKKLYKQLLLMRMFFEVYKDSGDNINYLDKYKIFQKYIDEVSGQKKSLIEELLRIVVRKMIERKDYSSVFLSDLQLDKESLKKIYHFADNTILISRRIVVHLDSILEREKEELYFVFDEMRDYCVARYALELFVTDDDEVDDEKVFNYLDDLYEESSSCFEGVVNYIYRHYRNDDKDEFCKKIMNQYIKPCDEVRDIYGRGGRNELQSWGLSIIFDENNDLKYFEKEYIKFIMYENPGAELPRLFNFFIKEEERNGKYNLSIYFDILFEVHIEDRFIGILNNTLENWHSDGISVSDFISVDKKLKEVRSDGIQRFRMFVILYLTFFNWKEKNKTKEYFQKVCDVKQILNEIRERISLE